MERVPLPEAIKRVWDALIEYGTPLASAVAKVFESFNDYPSSEIEDALYSIVGNEGWREASKGVPAVLYERDSPFYECSNVDARGRVIDIITQSEIPAGRLFSYVSGGKKYCFDIKSLKEYIQRSKGEALNPLTRELFPESVVEEIMTYDEKERRVWFKDEYVTYEDYMTYGDLILHILGKSENILESLLEYDVDGDGVSLYAEHLDERVSEDLRRVELEEFFSKADRDAKLLLMYRYAKRLSSELSESVKLFLGAILRLLPVFADAKVIISEEDTVGDVIIRALSVYGYDKWSTMDIMYEGESLHDLDYDDLVLDVAPDVTFYVVLADYEEEQMERMRFELGQYATKKNVLALLHAMDYMSPGELLEKLDTVTNHETILDTYSIVDEADEDEYLYLLVTRLLQLPSSFDTMNAVHKALGELNVEKIPDIILAYGLKRVNPLIDWEGYVGLISNNMSIHTGSATLPVLARGYISGNLPDEISLPDVAFLGSSQLMEDLWEAGRIDKDDRREIVRIAARVGTGGNRGSSGGLIFYAYRNRL